MCNWEINLGCIAEPVHPMLLFITALLHFTDLFLHLMIQRSKYIFSLSSGIPVQCKRASIGLRAGAFLLHLGPELHLAFPRCTKTVRGLLQGRCKAGSESLLCMLLPLKYSFTACPLEGPFMRRKRSVNKNQAQRAWKAIAREFKPFYFKLFQIRAAPNLHPDSTAW